VFDENSFKEPRFRFLSEIFNTRFDVYCHHLRVRNLTPHRPIKNCRVWLKKIEVQNVAGGWDVNDQFAVPRMMEWAPSEHSRNERTFSTHQVFDFGQTLSNGGGFVVTIERTQGGRFNPLFKVGKKVRFFFYATAENYQPEKEFCFEIEVPPSVGGTKVTPATVRDCTVS